MPRRQLDSKAVPPYQCRIHRGVERERMGLTAASDLALNFGERERTSSPPGRNTHVSSLEIILPTAKEDTGTGAAWL